MNNQQIQPLSLSDKDIISAVKLCACGCGKPVTKLSNKWINGHSTRNPDIKRTISEKSKLTNMIRYGVDNPFKSDQIKKQIKQTNLKRIGVDNPFKLVSKIKQSYIDKLGIDNPSKLKIIKDKKVKTNLKNRNVEHPMQCKEIKEKVRQTTIINHGVANILQCDEGKRKIKQTMIERYGKENSSQIKEFQDKKRRNCLIKYGVDSSNKRLDVKQKLRLNAIRQVEIRRLNGEPLMPNIGIQERPFLNELQSYTEYKIIRNDHSFAYTIARFPDGHIPELKLFIQFDERHHFKDKECTIYQDDDIQCTKDLESIPGYKVFRISEKESTQNKNHIIQQFLNIIQQQKELNETS